MFELLAIYLTAAFAIDAAIPQASILHLHVYDAVFALMIEVYAIVFVAGFVVCELRHVPRDRTAVGWIWERLRMLYINVPRLASFACAVIYGRVLTDTFTSLKAAIPTLHPYAWDETFMRWDRVLHGGRQAWELLQPFAIPNVTLILNVLYNTWMFVLFGVFMWQAWSANEHLRRRFFLTFGLAWMLLGTLAATGLSSAGPCYYSRISKQADDPYAPLMAYLREVNATHHLWALDVQDALWQAYAGPGETGISQSERDAARVLAEGGDRFGHPAGAAADDSASVGQMLEGISAMPSMHVAMAVLFALLGWAVDRRLGLAFTLFAISIQIGSVHLGWHYAIDGYASAIAVTALWLVVGRALGAAQQDARSQPMRS